MRDKANELQNKEKKHLCRFQNLLMEAPALVCVMRGPTHIYELANANYMQLVGNRQVVGKPIREVLPELEGQGFYELLDEVYKTGKSFIGNEMPVKLDKGNGKEEDCYLKFVYQASYNEGEIDGILVYGVEVTEQVIARKKIEESKEEIQKSKDHLEFILESAKGGHWDMDFTTGKAVTSFRHDKCFGATEPIEDWSYEKFLTYVHPDDRENENKKFNTALATGSDWSIDCRVVWKDGSIHWIQSSGRNYGYIDGKPTRMLGMVREVTEQKEAQQKIEESEQLFKLSLSGSNQTVFSQDRNLKHTWIYNPHPDFKAEDVIGKTDEDIHVPSTASTLTVIKQKVLDSGTAFNGDVEIELGGQKLFYTMHIEAIADKGGCITGIIGTVTDITERIKTQQKIEESEQLLQVAVKAVQGILWTNNAKGEMEGEQLGWAELTGQTYEEYKGYGWTNAVHPDDAATTLKAWEEAVKERKIFIFEHRVKIKDGQWRDFSIRAIPLLNSDGTLQQWVGVHTDITENKQAAKALKESEEQFSTLADNMENLAWLADAEGYRYWFNNRWLEYTGLNMEESQGLGWQKVPHPDHLERVSINNKRWDSNEAFELTIPLRRYDGEYKWFLTRVFPMLDEEGKVTRWVGTNTDIDKQKKAEDQFRVLADQAPMWVWLTDKEVNVLYANPELLRFIGISHSREFTGQVWEQKVHPEDISIVYNSFGEAVSLQQCFLFDCRLLNASTQQYEWFYIKVVPRMEAGEVIGFIGTAININEQRLILSQLEYRKALLEAHNESSLDGILLVDTNGKILSFNRRFVEIWNMPQQIVEDKDDETALAFALTQLVNPEAFMERVRWMYENTEEISIDELEFKDGKIIERYGYHVGGTDGSYYGCSWIFKDITQQRKYERALKESEKKFRLLADAMPQQVWLGDSNGNLYYFNQSVYNYSGLTKEQINKDGWIQIVHPDDREENIKKWSNAVNTGKDFLLEHRFRRYDGEYRWQLSRAIPQKDNNGNVQMWVGTSTDIQDQKTREEKKDEFISIASHEMKTPLTTAKAYLHMLENMLDQNNDKATLYAKKAKQSVNRLNELTSELLDVSKIKFGKLDYTITTFNFNEMIESTIENMQLTSQTHRIIKTGEVKDTVTGDQNRLEQVVINFLTNAIKYSPRAEKVFVNVEQNNENITVSVKDMGIGIAQKSLDRIFEKYHRVQEHAVHFQGLGIGLFICYEIIERHHGRLWAESEPGKGSTFYFTIPVNSNL